MALHGASKLYPKSVEKRRSIHDPEVRRNRFAFWRAATLNFLWLQLLFLGLFAYVFASLYQQNGHTHNLNVVFVDYSGGNVGTAVREAYAELKGAQFPTLFEKPASQYPDPAVSLREEVCRRRYWAAFYVHPDADLRLSTALQDNSAATAYNRSNVLTYVWNEARYSATMDAVIANNLAILSQRARIVWSDNNGDQIVRTLPTNDTAALRVFTNPWTLTDINIQRTVQGSRLIYNTLVVILLVTQEFFYLGTINGLYQEFQLYSSIKPQRIINIRILLSACYTFIGSLCVTAMIWAFKAGWEVGGGQFMLNWMTLWLFAHVNFNCLDIFTIWIPPPFVPMCMISWVALNITSILGPFALAPAFYRWGYALPTHSVYNTLNDVWSGGCNPTLHWTLPVLFSWEIVGLTVTSIGVYRRCHLAVIAVEKQETAFKARMEAALAFERQRDEKIRDSTHKRITQGISEADDAAEKAVDRAELEAYILRNEDVERESRNAASNGRFGPTFSLAFGPGALPPLDRASTAPAYSNGNA